MISLWFAQNVLPSTGPTSFFQGVPQYLVPCPFPGGTTIQLLLGVPPIQSLTGVCQPGQDGISPSGLDGSASCHGLNGGAPLLSRTGWATPHWDWMEVPPQKTDQQSKYLLHSRLCASCVYAG